MKVVHVVNGYLPHDSGGVQIHVRDLCLVQRQQGLETSVFTRIGGPELEDLALSSGEWEGVPVTRLTNNYSDCDSFEKIYTHPRIDERFDGFLSADLPDVVHFHHLTGLSTSMIEVAKRRGVAAILTLHDYWLVCPRGQRLHPDDLTVCRTLDRQRCLPCIHRLWPHLVPLEAGELPITEQPSFAKLRAWEEHIRRMLDLCDATIAPSAFHRDRFLEIGVSPERSSAIPNGLPRQDLLAEPRGRRPVRHLGFIGTVIPSKGIHVLIAAFNRLRGRDLVLHVHGEVVPYHERTGYLEELEAAVAPGLDVRFHGRYEQRDLPRILASLDLLIAPSLWWEAFCLTAREGALAGLPVVAFDIGGLAQAVADGLALGCEPGNAEELAERIARLCDDEDLRDEMSRKAHLVDDMEQCATAIEAVYRKALGVDGPPAPVADFRSTCDVSLVVPTWNAGAEFPEILRLMLAQELDGDLEVIVIDSGSTDGTAELLRSQPVRLIEIPNAEFNHGLTRNRGIQEAGGEIVVLATQDARPYDSHWLRALVECFDDPQVAGAYSGQMPRADASPFIKERLSHWAAAQPEPRVQRVDDREEFEALAPLEKLQRVAFDNVSSSVRRSVAVEIPFRRRQFGEDLDWGHRAILAGHKIVFQPHSRVVHSHNKSIWYEFKRVYLDHQNLHRLLGVHTIPRRQDVWPCSRGAIRHLWQVVEGDGELSDFAKLYWRVKAVPFGFSQNLAQFLGARSVARLAEGRIGDRLLDRLLRRGV